MISEEGLPNLKIQLFYLLNVTLGSLNNLRKINKVLFEKLTIIENQKYHDSNGKFILVPDKINGPINEKFCKIKSLKYIEIQDLKDEKFLSNFLNNINKNQLKYFDSYYSEIQITSLISTTLKELKIQKSKLSVNDLKLLSELNFYQLRSLNLCNNGINAEGLIYLKNCDFSNLKELILCCNSIEDDGVKILSEIEIQNLKYLSLRDCFLSDNSFKYLSLSNYESLISLNLYENNFKGDLGEIYNCKFPRVKTLNLASCKINSLHNLSKCYFPQLTELDLYWNLIDDEGLKHLRNFSTQNLLKLNLSCNTLTNQSIDNLSYCKLHSLKRLSLSCNKIDNLGMELIMKCNFSLIQKLFLDENQLSEGCLDFLKLWKFPKLRLISLEKNKFHNVDQIQLAKNFVLQNK